MKQITVTDEYGNKYTLRYTAKTVMALEKAGFDPNEIDSKPRTMITLLWNYAFLAEHKNTTDEQRAKIYAGLKNKEGLLAKLVEMYSEPLAELVSEGNAEWEASF